MPVPNTLRYFSSLLLAFACAQMAAAQAPQDTIAKPKKTPEMRVGHQLRLAFDVSKPIVNALAKNRESYEIGIDYYWRRESYFVVEGGFGKASVDYPDLAYNSSNSFFRIGVDKGMLQRLFPKDWDAAFIGIRYGMGLIKRGDAFYTVNDPLYGSSSGTLMAHNYTAHWAEITGGVRVELLKNLMAGWNVRAKFMLNASAFNELAPSYIAGYGKGDGSTAFDFNFNLCYVFRWGKADAHKAP